MAVTNIPPEDLFEIFGLRHETARGQSWDLKASEKRSLPGHLEKLLHGWDEVFRSIEQNEIIQSWLNSIIVLTLAARRRGPAFVQHGAQRKSITSTNVSASYENLRWVLEKPLWFRCKIRGKRTKIQIRTDYALWYGSRANLDTNLVVVQAKRLYDASCCGPQVIAFMAIVHRLRKQRGRMNAPIYGIATDTWYWYFLRLDPDGVVSKHVVDWNTDPMEVFFSDPQDHGPCCAPCIHT
ncbi:hypothetical protein BJX62DRAFT_242733 [Aspergillus germanicus]